MKSILFSAEMVRARRAGRKTQTRRVVKPQPLAGSELHLVIEQPAEGGSGVVFRGPGGMDARPVEYQKPGVWTCPYGQPGDVLAVKEAAWMWCAKVISGVTRKTKQPKVCWVECRNVPPVFCADRAQAPDWVPEGKARLVGALGYEWRKKIGRFLPGWAVRDRIEVVAVRVERLQEIGEADAIHEGMEPSLQLPDGSWIVAGPARGGRYREGFRYVWGAINGPGSWDLNPWVWVVEFRERAAAPPEGGTQTERLAAADSGQ